jgi:Cu2+-exporting ATPase
MTTDVAGLDLTACPLPRSTPAACAHCAGVVPLALVRADAERQFCCHGCETVYGIIHAQGLDEYYTHKRATDEASRPARLSGRTYGELDDPTLQARHVRALPGGLAQIELFLEGVHCAACVWLLERTSRLEPGVVEVRLDLGRGLAVVTWDPLKVRLSRIAQLFDQFGYPPHPTQGASLRDLRKKEDRAMLIRIAVAGAAFGNVMLMAFALYGGVDRTIEPEFEAFFRWGSLAVSLPAFLYSAEPFWRGALSSLRTRTPHMDLPIAIGLAVGVISGAVHVVLGHGEIYFDSLCALVFLLLAGRWLQRRQQRRAADAAELLYSVTPQHARVVEVTDGVEAAREVPIEAVVAGALLEVRAGEHVPADGTVERGDSSVDASLLTGESRPVRVGPGVAVHAGVVNLTQPLYVRAEKTGDESRFGKLMKMVEDAAQRRAPIVLAADQMANRFTVRVIGTAVVGLVGWLLYDPSRALENTIALLVVACPCALGLATPLAVSAAIGKAARRGILVKGGDALERLARRTLVLFDKTGTLTEGKQSVVEVAGDLTVRRWVHALELGSAHPIARAIVDHLAPHADPTLQATALDHTLGAGLAGTVEGHRVHVGSPRYMGLVSIPIPAWAETKRVEWAARALTTVLVAVDGQVMTLVGVGDRLRPDAAASLRRLEAMGYTVGILSGDDPAVVATVAAALGVPAERARGGASPEDKLRTVEALEGDVIMVGDGINDAAALSRARVGIAVHGGAEASLAAADIFLDRPGVGPVVEALEGADRTLATIRRNMRFSLAYNVTGIGLALFGLIGPIGAALLMPISSITVVVSSFRSRTFDPAARREDAAEPNSPPTGALAPARS